MKIRKAELKDLSRIAEIFVFNNRINYFPIFHEEAYSFGEMPVSYTHLTLPTKRIV